MSLQYVYYAYIYLCLLIHGHTSVADSILGIRTNSSREEGANVSLQ